MLEGERGGGGAQELQIMLIVVGARQTPHGREGCPGRALRNGAARNPRRGLQPADRVPHKRWATRPVWPSAGEAMGKEEEERCTMPMPMPPSSYQRVLANKGIYAFVSGKAGGAGWTGEDVRICRCAARFAAMYGKQPLQAKSKIKMNQIKSKYD
ncbi:hypothetical protein LZ32DRAFT_175547 [Colletotrichum eremochloae]|nr:hypothetical protein LZ32DRAFT_175547 [Colletotrichum eremochloae]